MTSQTAMRPDGRANGNPGPTAAAVSEKVNALSKADLHYAIETFDKVWQGTFGKGGYRELADKANKKQGEISALIHGLALRAVEMAANDLPLARASFLALCAAAESHARERIQKEVSRKNELFMRDDGSPKSLKEALPIWSVSKAYINAGFEKNLSPADFKGPSAIDQKLREIRKDEAKAASNGTSEGGTANTTPTTASGADRTIFTAEQQTAMSTRLQAALNILFLALKELGSAPEAVQDKCAGILNGTATRIRNTVNAARPETPEAVDGSGDHDDDDATDEATEATGTAA